MSFLHYRIAAALVSGPLAAYAQPTVPHPADANARVPPPAYQSAFEAYRSSADQEETPDRRWRAANDEMGRLGGHAGHLKEAMPAQSRPAPDAKPSMPAQQHRHH